MLIFKRQKCSLFLTGNNYYIGFFQNQNSGSINFYLTNTDSLDLSYTIEAPGIGYYNSGTISVERSVYVQLASSLIVGPYNNQNKGIHLKINSTNAVVIGQNLQSSSREGDTFLALPTVTLCSTDKFIYYGISVSSGGYDSVVLIVGTESNTIMELTVTQNVSVRINDQVSNLISGIEYSFIVNRLQTVYIGSPHDLTGTRIVTDKSVSVFSGHQCGYVPSSSYDDCEHIIEQVPPTIYWGRSYYIAPLEGRDSYTIRVLAAYNSTNIVIYCNLTRSFHTVNPRDTFSSTHQSYCAIHSNKEILVAQYSHGYDYDSKIGNPMMMLVPATVHYSNEINLSTSSSSDYNNYINIIVLKEYFQPHMIYWIRGGVKQSLQSEFWTPIVFNQVTEAYYAQLRVSQGAITIMHTNSYGLISAVVYGFASRQSYGHTGGFSLLKNFPG